MEEEGLGIRRKKKEERRKKKEKGKKEPKKKKKKKGTEEGLVDLRYFSFKKQEWIE